MSDAPRPPSNGATLALLIAFIALMRTCGPAPATRSQLSWEESSRRHVERRVEDLERKVRDLERKP